jgi:hypothetical protein
VSVVHEVFVPRGIEEEIRNVIECGIEAKPSVIAALGFFLTRRGETSLETAWRRGSWSASKNCRKHIWNTKNNFRCSPTPLSDIELPPTRVQSLGRVG